MSSVPAAIIAVIGLIPSIFKHKPNCVWHWSGEKWDFIGGPFSARQCRKQIDTLVKTGMDRDRFIILRKGITPTNEFNPPKPKEGK